MGTSKRLWVQSRRKHIKKKKNLKPDSTCFLSRDGERWEC